MKWGEAQRVWGQTRSGQPRSRLSLWFWVLVL